MEHLPGAVDAGRFGAWLDGVAAAVEGAGPSDVPCGTCTGCCTSAQFVLVEADEVDTRRRIPDALLFPAPGRPGDHLLGYDEQGRCPMLGDGGCTVYAHRPRACRTYDCRVFAAAGLDPADGDPTKAAIGDRVRRWRFSHPGPADLAGHEAVRAAAAQVAASDPAAPPLAVALGAVRVVLRGR